MINTESYFNAMNSLKVLKPVKTYPANSGRKTSITGFDEMLNKVSAREENKKADTIPYCCLLSTIPFAIAFLILILVKVSACAFDVVR